MVRRLVGLTLTAYAVLLRGVNLGGRGRLAMGEFAELLTGIGCRQVATYLQSGNAVVVSERAADDLAAAVSGAFAERGRDIGVLARSAPELARVAGSWPFDPAAPGTARHVTFVQSATGLADRLAGLTDGLGQERVSIGEAELYLWLPAGMGRSKLPQLVGRRLQGQVSTTRNWNTVTALAERTAALAGDGG